MMMVPDPLAAIIAIIGCLGLIGFILLIYGDNPVARFAGRHPRLVQWLIAAGVLAVALAAAVLPLLHPEWGDNMTNISVI